MVTLIVEVTMPVRPPKPASKPVPGSLIVQVSAPALAVGAPMGRGGTSPTNEMRRWFSRNLIAG